MSTDLASTRTRRNSVPDHIAVDSLVGLFRPSQHARSSTPVVTPATSHFRAFFYATVTRSCFLVPAQSIPSHPRPRTLRGQS